MAAAIETKLYVTNFPSSATRQQLQQFFSRFGRVQECAIMWNSYAFVHYATMEEARRALDQSNGAMFLNRKLIVQLSTSRFRPQPKEINNSISQQPKQLMVMANPPPPSSSINYQNFTNGNNTGGGSTIKNQQQQSNTLAQQYPNELNYDMITSYNPQHSLSCSSPVQDGNNFFPNTYRPPSPYYLPQEINNGYYPQYPPMPIDRMTPSPLSLQTNKINHIKSNKNIKTDVGANGEIPKLYCTNLPDNCKVNDLQRLFSPFGHVIDCVILWDYYAFVTFKTFLEAEHALHTLHGYTWKDRRLIVEWSRASGRRQQQISPSPTTPKLNSFGSEVSTPPSPRTRPSTLLSHQSASNEQFYGNNSPKILSPLKSQSPHHTFNQNLAMMSIIQQQQQPVLHHHHQHSSIPYGNYTNRNNLETLTNENQPIFDGLTNSSSTHHLNLSPFIDRNTSNSNTLFPSPSEIATPSSPVSTTNVYQPSDIVALLEPSSSDVSINTKPTENSVVNDITNILSPTITNIQSSCSSTAAATANLYQENLLSSLFGSFEPFSKLFPIDEQSTSTSRYNILPASPLLTTAPDNSHHPIYYGHNTSWD
ncbi:unnamed protein product [Rotaria sp. Silwood2]|nr:unnamed protein product [Rotaria sp. Silwood2]CAF2524824.1 unnamed protein product [Rotaria sp. Silwood2]CAF2947530.1 unnamed protein product [Rotaria sp. Silwood2]CAF3924291.1 unnamed protein product [Rotaria sp. Silwood2]CAF4059454.1 unnamed protein product [Rotaria sp. Silwood2]